MIRKINVEISLAIFLLGVPLANILKELTNGRLANLSNPLMGVAIILLFCGGSYSLTRMKKEYALFIAYQFIILFSAMLASVGLMQNNYGLVYTIFCIIGAYGLSLNKRPINEDLFLKILWWGSGVLSTAVLYLITNHFTVFYNIKFVYLAYGTDRLTLSRCIIIYIACFLAYRPKRRIETVLKWIFLIISLYDIMLLNRRSHIILVLLMFGYYMLLLFQHGFRLKKKYIFSVFGIVIFGVVMYFIIRNNQELLKDLNRYLDSVANALSTFQEQTETDASAMYRVQMRREYWEQFTNEFSLFEVLFGKGYMYEWLDFPAFQIIIDMGLIGGILYFLLHGSLYFKLYFQNRKIDTPLMNFVKFYSVVPLTANFRGGFPYGYTVYLPFLFIMYVMLNEENKRQPNGI